MALGWTLAPIYFVEEVGMDPLELVLAGTALEIAYFLFEVPTGVVADTYSRRLSVVAAQFIMGIGFRPDRAVRDVGVILAAAALMGFGWTFKSGAIDALARRRARPRAARRCVSARRAGEPSARARRDRRGSRARAGRSSPPDRRWRRRPARTRRIPRVRHAGDRFPPCVTRGRLGAHLDDANRARRRTADPRATDPPAHPRHHVLRRHVERKRRPAVGGAFPRRHRRARSSLGFNSDRSGLVSSTRVRSLSRSSSPSRSRATSRGRVGEA